MKYFFNHKRVFGVTILFFFCTTSILFAPNGKEEGILHLRSKRNMSITQTMTPDELKLSVFKNMEKGLRGNVKFQERDYRKKLNLLRLVEEQPAAPAQLPE